ncbi:asparagine synthase (glutamine-hydrolyzing) [Faecalibacter rhinopitheci]|uniref:asparagine synthase (glutamine-hydrolyzing) n=1 Tax=Faecalibacter rhinopitheci TaxID=2779678 RepID=A0A8J7KA29_9FLAO|nr:asparagine synthase (glutamine-hydrolyzing) [Faecalibacter rhinopitheci]MBF0596995.1 asparagine synthase (glutamine-hydrolyzing) [Faecalibacter rhinopitheci]
MCGFSGVFSKEELNEDVIVNSLKSIKHRGPNNTLHACFEDDLKLFSSDLSDEETQLKYPNFFHKLSSNWIGFNRLSILDLSNNGMQPFYDTKSKIAFLLNGEVYNFKTLKDKYLIGIDLKSGSDTEVVFQLYLKFGDQFIDLLQGMFVIVVIDYYDNKIKIWRDRFGIKPFYYYLDEHQFIFSSEIKGIFETGLVKKEINYKHLAYSFYLNSSFAPHTIYENIYTLEAANKLTVDFLSFKFKKEIYWTLDYIPNNQEISKEEFLDDIKSVVKLASISDVQQAVMLSGGLDSGLLAYQLHQNSVDVDAITIYNEEADEQNELTFARSNAINSELELLEIEIPNDVSIQELKEYILAEEEPNYSPEPAYFLSKKAKENNYVVLHNALGLDELFYGYSYYYKAKQLENVKLFLHPSLKMFLSGNKKFKYEDLTIFGLEGIPFILRSIASWQEIKTLFKKYGSENWEHPVATLLNQVRKNNPNFDTYPLLKKISYLDIYYYISSHHSLRSDSPSMVNNIEMRFPYLDHLFIQKYFNCSRLDNGLSMKNNKPYLRKCVKNILPNDVMNMPKKGFSMPTKSWLNSVDVIQEFPEIEYFFDDISMDWLNNSTKKWLLISTSLLLK